MTKRGLFKPELLIDEISLGRTQRRKFERRRARRVLRRKANQSMSRYRDFDAELAALEPIKFRMKGTDYEVPPDVPCDGILQLLAEGKISADPSAMDTSVVPEILEAIVGEEQLTQMRSAGMGMRQLSDLAKWLMLELGLSDVEEEEEAPAAGDTGNGSRSLTPSNVGER